MHKSIIFLALLLSLTSCFKERIEPNYNTGENKKLVITAWITSLDEPQFVNISRTVNYLGGFEPDMVSGAEVSLEDGVTVYTLVENEAGFYYLPSDWTARIGDIYQLKVSYEGEEYTASHQMRPCPEIEEAFYQLAEITDTIEYYETVFSFQELIGEGDAYYATDYVKGNLEGDSLIYGEYADDQFVDGQYFEEIVLSEGEYFQSGDTAVIDFYSIGLETANFLQDIENEIFRGSPFDAPPANVRTNITGDAIGYFIISDARRTEIIIP